MERVRRECGLEDGIEFSLNFCVKARALRRRAGVCYSEISNQRCRPPTSCACVDGARAVVRLAVKTDARESARPHHSRQEPISGDMLRLDGSSAFDAAVLCSAAEYRRMGRQQARSERATRPAARPSLSPSMPPAL